MTDTEHIKQNLADAEQELSSIKAQRDWLAGALTAEIEQLQGELEEAKKMLGATDRLLAEEEQLRRALKQDFIYLSSTFKQVADERDQLAESADARLRKISTLQQQLESLEKDRERWYGLATDRGHEIVALKARLSPVHDAGLAQHREAERQRLIAELAAWKNRAATAEAQVANLQAQRDELRAAMPKLQKLADERNDIQCRANAAYIARDKALQDLEAVRAERCAQLTKVNRLTHIIATITAAIQEP